MPQCMSVQQIGNSTSGCDKLEFDAYPLKIQDKVQSLFYPFTTSNPRGKVDTCSIKRRGDSPQVNTRTIYSNSARDATRGRSLQGGATVNSTFHF